MVNLQHYSFTSRSKHWTFVSDFRLSFFYSYFPVLFKKKNKHLSVFIFLSSILRSWFQVFITYYSTIFTATHSIPFHGPVLCFSSHLPLMLDYTETASRFTELWSESRRATTWSRDIYLLSVSNVLIYRRLITRLTPCWEGRRGGGGGVIQVRV